MEIYKCTDLWTGIEGLYKNLAVLAKEENLNHQSLLNKKSTEKSDKFIFGTKKIELVKVIMK